MKKNGISILVGVKGTGMGLFSIMMALKMRKYFDKTVVLDYKPRPIFGDYILFTRDMFVREIIDAQSTGD